MRFATLACAALSIALGSSAIAYELKSPDGQIQVQLELKESDGKSQLRYQVSVAGEPLIDDSSITFVRKDNVVIGDHLKFVSQGDLRSHDETWNPVCGERAEIRDQYQSQTFQFVDTEADCPLTIELRCYDCGVAFRTTLGDAGSSGPLTIKEERSEFRFAGDYPAWRTTSAQGEYDKVPLSKLGTNVERPLTVEVSDNRCAAIAEAQLVDYAAMRLRAAGDGSPTVVSQLRSEVSGKTPLTTPWRVIMIGGSPGDLLEHDDLILNLNEPCAIADTSWIKPGKVIREISLTTEGAKTCVDFAAANNFQYVEFDAGWYGYEYDDASDATTVTLDPRRSAGPLDLQDVIKYAKERNIGILVYVNRRALEKQLDEILPLYKSWGIAGVKYGFVNVGSQQWTAWLHDAVRKAADHQLMVDIHDEYRPVGYSRTYPNLMTQEGVRGDEATPSTSLAVTTLFTRNLAGAADHTICYFDPRVDKNWSHGQQLAKAVCTYSPWQFIYWYDTPLTSQQDGKKSRSRIVASPELEFYKQVPTVWDETRVLDGKIGEYAVIARRSGDDWYIGAINANQKREFSFPLDFLAADKTYQARSYRDDPTLNTKTKVRIEDEQVNAESELVLTLEPNGGEAIRISPAK
ncbi:glycoside hydrolase family 97 protein [Blastopirellula sp. JC732]|uniref:Glycoside hydrolase family 97 protein n=1 Tax=Blastopirellula sediminis TaxID=2894196 RepID=A0A9X1SIW8_9BACT|nr:glycoside hydrolase family 97 protein [Blastopirellula sediminis]MCC9604993.1 glycoside hydrolase family 97 protein [Blastopirellula sediminis]MCC9631707.1 glycoside hydrolase family 97 protein [Blastopirellula sediminis]